MNKQVQWQNLNKHLTNFPAFVFYFPTHTPFLLISPSAYFPFSSLLTTLISFICSFPPTFLHIDWMHTSTSSRHNALVWPVPGLCACVCVCVLSVYFVGTANWSNTATMWHAMPANLMLSTQAVSPTGFGNNLRWGTRCSEMFYLICVCSVSMEATHSSNKIQPVCQHCILKVFVSTCPGTGFVYAYTNCLGWFCKRYTKMYVLNCFLLSGNSQTCVLMHPTATKRRWRFIL